MNARAVFLALAALALVVVVWLSATALLEAYGDGPPYYGRSVNMDKWRHPGGYLAAVIIPGAAVIAALLWLARGGRRDGG